MEVNKDDNNAADTILPKNVAPAGVMEYILNSINDVTSSELSIKLGGILKLKE